MVGQHRHKVAKLGPSQGKFPQALEKQLLKGAAVSSKPYGVQTRREVGVGADGEGGKIRKQHCLLPLLKYGLIRQILLEAIYDVGKGDEESDDNKGAPEDAQSSEWGR